MIILAAMRRMDWLRNTRCGFGRNNEKCTEARWILLKIYAFDGIMRMGKDGTHRIIT